MYTKEYRPTEYRPTPEILFRSGSLKETKEYYKSCIESGVFSWIEIFKKDTQLLRGSKRVYEVHVHKKEELSNCKEHSIKDNEIYQEESLPDYTYSGYTFGLD